MRVIVATICAAFVSNGIAYGQRDVMAVALRTHCVVGTPNGRIAFTSIRAVGRRADLLALVRSSHLLQVHECSCLLLGGDRDVCTLSSLPSVEVPARAEPLPEHRVLLIFSDHAEFASLFNALRGGGGGYPPSRRDETSPADGGPRRRAAPFVVRPCSAESGGCEPAGDVEFTTEGEAKFTVGCENGIQVEASTTGEVNLKMKAGVVTMSTPIVHRHP
jgi:hypothetical protein